MYELNYMFVVKINLLRIFIFHQNEFHNQYVLYLMVEANTVL